MSISNEFKHKDYLLNIIKQEFPSLDLDKTRINFARPDPEEKEGEQDPLELFDPNRPERFGDWQARQTTTKNITSKIRYIISLIQLTPKDRWLFAGVFEICGQHTQDENELGKTIYKYPYKEVQSLNRYTGKLIIKCSIHGKRSFRIYENLQAPLIVTELKPDGPSSENLILLEQKPEAGVEIRIAQVSIQKRDTELVKKLKRTYNNQCMFCGVQLKISEDLFYSEAAHIKRLGSPDHGPDTEENVIILCPNHHVQFDNGVLWIEAEKDEKEERTKYYIKSIFEDDPLNNKELELKHAIKNSHIQYHQNMFSR